MTVAEAPKEFAHGLKAWPLSVKAYHALGELGLIPEKTELLYGQVFPKMSKSPFHAALFLRLLKLVQAALPEDCHIRPEQLISCEDSEPEPDLAVIQRRIDDFWHEHPRTAELVIEVCVTSTDYDRSKLRAYASAGVKECWLVLGPEKQIEVYRQPTGNQFSEYIVHGPGGQLNSMILPGLAVELDRLFSQ